jgi:hypothetical protein
MGFDGMTRQMCPGSGIAKRRMGENSRLISERYPEQNEWCEGSLWVPGCFHGSVGHGAEVVENYIKSQEGLTSEERIEDLHRNY